MARPAKMLNERLKFISGEINAYDGNSQFLNLNG